jgi:hypothetical protein
MIKEELIPSIEKALGITLYDHQKNYLINGAPMPKIRRNGKTTAYCIDLAFSYGPPIDMQHPERYCDLMFTNSNYLGWFRDFFLDIYCLLLRYKLPVRPVKLRDRILGLRFGHRDNIFD